MIAIHPNKLLHAISKHESKVSHQLRISRLNLIIYLRKNIGMLTSNEVTYLWILIKYFRKIVFAKPEEIIKLKDAFELVIPAEQFEVTLKDLREDIIAQLGYKRLRKNIYPLVYESLGIKACVYCNSQLTVVISDAKSKSARFQVDHFEAKSLFPFLCISFFNLYPVCASCNGKKSDKNVSFKLYSEDPSALRQSKSSFKIPDSSLIRYRATFDSDYLDVEFDDDSSGTEYLFNVSGIYNTQKDLTEELFIKSLVYNKSYKSALQKSLNKLFPEKSSITARMIIGNYALPAEIHKRPLAKFTQDIARQLGIIN